MNQVDLFRVELGQPVRVAFGDAVHEREEDLAGAARLGHGILLIGAGQYCPEWRPR